MHSLSKPEFFTQNAKLNLSVTVRMMTVFQDEYHVVAFWETLLHPAIDLSAYPFGSIPANRSTISLRGNKGDSVPLQGVTLVKDRQTGTFTPMG